MIKHGMTGETLFYPTYLPFHSIQPALLNRHVLAVARFNSNETFTDDPCHIAINLPDLEASERREVWISREPVISGWHGKLGFAHNGSVLMGHLSEGKTDHNGLEALAHRTYRDILEFLPRKGYPYLIRVWSYFSGITENCGDTERYHAFCSGRHRAFAVRAGFQQNLPAASALGQPRGGPLQIYFLASRFPARQIENPRQISAFCYPRQYGPKSPSFSRAMWQRIENINYLYISGTASIVGHTSLHPDNGPRQLEETLANIQALLNSSRHKHYINEINQLFLLKVYLRYPDDLPWVQTVMSRLAPDVPVIYLQAEICREDLLMEVEGMGLSPASRAP